MQFRWEMKYLAYADLKKCFFEKVHFELLSMEKHGSSALTKEMNHWHNPESMSIFTFCLRKTCIYLLVQIFSNDLSLKVHRKGNVSFEDY